MGSACRYAPLSLMHCRMEERRLFLLASLGNISYGSEESCVLHIKVFDMHLGGKSNLYRTAIKVAFMCNAFVGVVLKTHKVVALLENSDVVS